MNVEQIEAEIQRQSSELLGRMHIPAADATEIAEAQVRDRVGKKAWERFVKERSMRDVRLSRRILRP